MSHLSRIQSSFYSLSELANQIDRWKIAGDKIVFTNGCFDILHQGHVSYLAAAADLGTRLIVAINTDSSVKRLGKGEERPVNPEKARAMVLGALASVSAVVCFDEDTPLNVIRILQPDVLVKGADYDPEVTDANSKKYIVGREMMLSFGGSVKVIPLVEGFSTTNIIQKLKQ